MLMKFRYRRTQYNIEFKKSSDLAVYTFLNFEFKQSDLILRRFYYLKIQ